MEKPIFARLPPEFYRVSAKAIIKRGDSILLGFERNQQHYTLPGGGIKWGETPHQALRRELSEEIGRPILWIADYPQYVLSHVVHNKRGLDVFYNLALYFEVHIDATDLVTETDHYQTLQWMSKQQLASANIFEGEVGIKDAYEPRHFIG